MALRTPRTDLHPPTISRTFVTAGAQIILADQLEPSGELSPAGAPMAGVNHLPSSVFVLSPAGGGTLVFLDAFGNSNSIVYPANATGGPHTLPFVFRSIEAGTTAGFSITVSWNPEA